MWDTLILTEHHSCGPLSKAIFLVLRIYSLLGFVLWAHPIFIMKFFNKKLYKLPNEEHSFSSRADAEFFCEQHGISTDLIEEFDSKKEYNRFLVLCEDERKGMIRDLKRQVEFEIIPRHTETFKVGQKAIREYHVNGNMFPTKRDAIQYCRLMRINQQLIKKTVSFADLHRTITVEKEAIYTADFTYYDNKGNYIVEDVKSDYTRKEKDYVLRRKLMLHVYGIKILET